MTYRAARIFALAGTLFITALAWAPIASATMATNPAIDAHAARSLALKNSCLRCHGVTKKKEGPTYTDVAAKYRDRPDAEDHLYKHVTSGEFVKLTDGHSEEHKILRSKSEAETRNLVRWILSQ